MALADTSYNTTVCIDSTICFFHSVVSFFVVPRSYTSSVPAWWLFCVHWNCTVTRINVVIGMISDTSSTWNPRRTAVKPAATLGTCKLNGGYSGGFPCVCSCPWLPLLAVKVRIYHRLYFVTSSCVMLLRAVLRVGIHGIMKYSSRVIWFDAVPQADRRSKGGHSKMFPALPCTKNLQLRTIYNSSVCFFSFTH